MPFISTTKRTRELGFQTFARVSRMPEPMRSEELRYLSVRDAYIQKRAYMAQFEEELEQAKKAGDLDRARELGLRCHDLQSQLGELRYRCRQAGAQSFAMVFMEVANEILHADACRAIRLETERLIGRPEMEVSS